MDNKHYIKLLSNSNTSSYLIHSTINNIKRVLDEMDTVRKPTRIKQVYLIINLGRYVSRLLKIINSATGVNLSRYDRDYVPNPNYDDWDTETPQDYGMRRETMYEILDKIFHGQDKEN